MFALLLLSMFAVYVVFTFLTNRTKVRHKGKTANPLFTNYEYKVQGEADSIVQPKQGSKQIGAGSAGILYLVVHDGYRAAKIGITRADSENDRIQSHIERGWKLEKCWNFAQLKNAEQVEGSVVAWFRNVLKLPHGVSSAQMPQGGHTETVSLASIGLQQISAFTSNLVDKTDGKEAVSVPISSLIAGASMRTFGELEAVTTSHRKAVFKGDTRWHEKYHEWQNWSIKDNGFYLTVELNSKAKADIRKLRVGSQVEVIGRVETVDGQFRMTNPVYTVIVTRPISRRKVEISNKESWLNRLAFRQTQIPEEIYADSKSNKKRKSSKTSIKPSTPIEKAARSLEISRPQLDDTYLVERCSACGAPVPNGANHDC